MQMVPDRLWAILEPLLPDEPAKPKGGRPRIADRAALAGILFVLRTGCRGRTCRRRWAAAVVRPAGGASATGSAPVWRRLEHELLQRLSDADAIDWSRAAVDSTSIPAKRGAKQPGRIRRIARKPGSKRHVVVDAQGIPLATLLTAANVTDSVVFEHVLNAIPLLHRPFGARGHPRRRPDKLHADKGYDKPHCRRFLHTHRIACRMARIGVESSTRLGRRRWVVERTGAWFNRFRRLRVRDERRADMHAAFISLASSLILLHFL